jgi:hypothetical protein
MTIDHGDPRTRCESDHQLGTATMALTLQRVHKPMPIRGPHRQTRESGVRGKAKSNLCDGHRLVDHSKLIKRDRVARFVPISPTDGGEGVL